MNVILYLVIVWLTCWLLGFGLVGLVTRGHSRIFSGSVAVSGYALSQVVFFIVFVLGFGVQSAIFTVLVFSAVLGLFYLIQCATRGNLSAVIFSFRRYAKLHAVLLLAVLVVAAVPYVTVGLGNYWSSAGEDVIDGLNGRSIFLAEDPSIVLKVQKLTASDELVRQLKSGSLKRLKQETGIELKEHEVIQDYLDEYGRLQYSSLVFWSKLLGLPSGMDTFLLQALFNLLLMGSGVYLLARETFKQPRGMAFSASLLATLGHFYLATFVNGHIGSLMYSAVALVFLYFCLRWIDERWRPGAWLILPLLWLTFMSLCYPYPLLYLIAPLVLYWGYRYVNKKSVRERQGRLIIFVRSYLLWVISTAVCIGFVVAWWIFEPIRERSEFMFRSWGTIFNEIGFLQFWGIWPSNLTNLPSMLGWLNQTIWLKSLSLALAASITIITVFGFYRIIKSGSVFMAVWLALSLTFFVLMRFVVGDSYYFYKFLYINAFMVMIALMTGMREVWVNGRLPLLRYASIGIFTVFLAANLANNGYSAYALSDKPYNKDFSAYRQILSIPRELLSQTYIDVPYLDHKDVLRQTVLASGGEIQTDKSRAKFLLTIDDMDDVIANTHSNPIWKYGALKLFTAPEHDLLNLASYWPPSKVQDGTPQAGQSFRWMTGGSKGYFMVDVIRPSNDAKYLVFCAASGPSFDYQPVKISWSDARASLESFMVSQYGCHWLNLSGRTGPFVFSSDAKGHIASAVDSRKLIYRVYRIALSKDQYDAETLKTMVSDQPDIVSLNKPQQSNSDGEILSPGQLILGGGWFSPEQFGNDFFRWVSNDSEIYIHKPQSSGDLLLDIEPGPSLSSLPMRLRVVDDDGNVLKDLLISARQEIAVRLPTSEKTQRVRFIVDSAGNPVPNDPRLLNFRVFKVRWISDATISFGGFLSE
jgi:hypothetical protein